MLSGFLVDLPDVGHPTFGEAVEDAVCEDAQDGSSLTDFAEVGHSGSSEAGMTKQKQRSMRCNMAGC
jgi:hypothetical protein